MCNFPNTDQSKKRTESVDLEKGNEQEWSFTLTLYYVVSHAK